MSVAIEYLKCFLDKISFVKEIKDELDYVGLVLPILPDC